MVLCELVNFFQQVAVYSQADSVHLFGAVLLHAPILTPVRLRRQIGVMSSSVTFEALAERVLAGEVSVETVPGVPAWPAKALGPGRAKAGSVFLFLHRDFPGVVAMVVFLRKRVELCGCFSDALRSYLADEYSADFNFEPNLEPDSALFRVLDSAAPSLWRGASLDEAFIEVPGVVGADLLRSLREVHFAARGSLH